METVKVDMQKLQLLNDRIAQTIEALNQLRLSVHGIQHTASPMGPWGIYPMNYGAFGQPSFVPGTFGPTTFGPQGYGTSFVSPYNVGFGGFGGMQHTSPITTTGYATPFVSNGLSHTTFDPYWQTRTMQPWTQTYPVSIY